MPGFHAHPIYKKVTFNKCVEVLGNFYNKVLVYKNDVLKFQAYNSLLILIVRVSQSHEIRFAWKSGFFSNAVTFVVM